MNALPPGLDRADQMRGVGYAGKRLFDVTAAAIAIVVLFPVMVVVAWIIWRRMGKPIFFRQRRPGLHEQLFSITKFRTMSGGSGDVPRSPAADAERLTSIGRTLRSMSLDELPELFNVLRGEMSLVGPRPLLEEYLPHYTDRERLRFRVRPGITGWAQVNGRNALPWEERFEHDVWYVEHCSFALDLRILAKTAARVLRRDDVRPDDTNLAQDRRRRSRSDGEFTSDD
jgi:sugar transferase EpsL